MARGSRGCRIVASSTWVCVLGREPSGRRRCRCASRGEEIEMDVLVERVAGLDVGKAVVVVCVRTPGPDGRRVSETVTTTPDSNRCRENSLSTEPGALQYGVARQTLHGWLRRYAAEGGIANLADRSSRPSSCPHQMPAARRRRPGDPAVLLRPARPHPGPAGLRNPRRGRVSLHLDVGGKRRPRAAACAAAAARRACDRGRPEPCRRCRVRLWFWFADRALRRLSVDAPTARRGLIPIGHHEVVTHAADPPARPRKITSARRKFVTGSIMRIGRPGAPPLGR